MNPTPLQWIKRGTLFVLGFALGILAWGCDVGAKSADGFGEDGSEKLDPALVRLLQPERLRNPAPDTFFITFDTSSGPFVVRIPRGWAPIGADRLYQLAGAGYYQGVRFHRVLDGYMAGFGIHGDPRVNAVWKRSIIADDPPNRSNLRGTVAFSMSGPNSRAAELFINLRDNPNLDGLGFVPVGEVVEGLEVAARLYSAYGDGPPRGEGPFAAMAQARGNAYLIEEFPALDWIESTQVVPPFPTPAR